jgi:WD40 repeat protein
LHAEYPQVPTGLYDRPVLVIDTGMHTTRLRASADRDGRWAVTVSDDKTVRIWSLADGALERTVRLPAGPDNIGSAYAVAVAPDGASIAVGGWTRWTDEDRQEQVYLFDRETGKLAQRIEGLTNNVDYLVFSPDGSRLAAGLGDGLCVYSKKRGWTELLVDKYWDAVYGADYAPDGRLATTCSDGRLRLYAPGRLRPPLTVWAPSGRKPLGIAFSPDGSRLAVGHYDGGVNLLDGRTLEPLPGPDMSGSREMELHCLDIVAWSCDGRTLLASGLDSRGHGLVLAWEQAGAGARRLLADVANNVHTLIALPGGDLLVAGSSFLIRVGPDGAQRWAQQTRLADFRAQFDCFTVSADGARVGFGYELGGRNPAYFDIAKRALVLGLAADQGMASPRLTGLNVEHWRNGDSPMLNGRELDLDPNETSRSLAIHPSGRSFVLGTSWSLRAYDSDGILIWRHSAPHEAWVVNITGDGRLVVAAHGDGTIRWRRMEDGAELLAFMPMADRSNWVAWTPEGFYAATAGAQGVLRWHVNQDWEPAETVHVEDIPGSYRPEVLRLILQELETPRALGFAVLAEHNRQVMLRTKSRISPGAQLHLLAIGIGQYNEEYARNLRLQFAGRDARDLASGIVNTQDGLYRVKPTVLIDRDANKAGILRGLKAMRAAMENGNGADLAVIHFSGHGALVDHKLYLLPYDIDPRDDAGIQSNGLSVEELRAELAEIGKRGRVLVLLDACHSGATTMSGGPLLMDSTALRTTLAAANVSVLTSSTGAEVSFELPELQHGAFTKALLDAFDDPAADTNRNGLINTTGLAAYVADRVPMLTGDKQHPGMEVRYHSTLFARSR